MAIRRTQEFVQGFQSKFLRAKEGMNAAPKDLDSEYRGRYPEGLDLSPGSELHDMILSQVLIRAWESRSMMERRFEDWNKISRNLTAYIPLDQAELTEKAKDDRKAFRVVMPMSYATREVFVTYAMAAFLQEPIFPYNPRNTEDIVKVALLELVVQAQMNNFKAGLQIYKALQDAITFGMGVLSPIWSKKMGYKSINRADLGGGESVEFSPIRTKIPLFEGNKLECWDPFRTLPDPDVPFDQVQDGEFFGGAVRLGKTALINLEASQKDEYFNCKYVDYIFGDSFTVPINDDSGRTEKWGSGINVSSGQLRGRSVDLIHMYIDIIPSDWGLGKSEEPEKWIFTVAGDSLVVRAKPTNLDHDMFPVSVISPAYDGHSNTPMSIIETVFGMQEIVDNLYNSWWANTRKTVNGVYVWDPGMVNPNDMKNIALAGGGIRTARAMWGRGVQNAIEQLPVNRVTDGNLQDASMIMSTVGDLMGATEPIQGIRRRTSERVSATEASQTNQAGLSKMEKMAKVMWLQGFHDLSFMIASQTIQLMEQEQAVKIVGKSVDELRYEYGLDKFAQVTPDTIDVPFDVVPHDGTIPGKGDANAWNAVLQTITKSPELMQELDAPRIFMHWARLSGAKDVYSFRRIAPQVMADQEVEKQVQQGNMVPMNGTMQDMMGGGGMQVPENIGEMLQGM